MGIVPRNRCNGNRVLDSWGFQMVWPGIVETGVRRGTIIKGLDVINDGPLGAPTFDWTGEELGNRWTYRPCDGP